MIDTVIIGSGPAGISAAIYLKMVGIDSLILTTNNSSLHKAKEIENYYGFKKISGEELYNTGIEQAKSFDIPVIEEEVIGIDYDDTYTVITDKNSYKTRTIILATGLSRRSLTTRSLQQFEGSGISYCAVCDGFFYKNKTIGVVGNSNYAIKEISHLKNISNDIILFTNGESDDELKKNFDFPIYTNKIKEFLGDKRLEKVLLDNDEEIKVDGLFIAVGVASGIDFAKKLGIESKDNKIIVDEEMKTNIPGIFAIGDVIGGSLQVNKAASDGGIVSKSIVKYLREKEY
jgi:thioredoxin reductase (NADPH)